MRFLIDIDGTVLTQQRPGEYEKCQPLPGAVETVNHLFKAGHQITFFTSRNFKFMQQTHEQLRGFGFNYHHLEFGKPHGDIIVDDRALRFTSWRDTRAAIEEMLGGERFDRRSADEDRSAPLVSSEQSRLDNLSAAHSYLKDFNEALSHYRARHLDRLGCSGESALEIGCGEGLLTRHLGKVFRTLDAVDASGEYLVRAKALAPGNVVFHQCLIEDFETSSRYDWIVAGGLLEHVANPQQILQRASGWLAPNGRIAIFVPNAVSMNRRLGKSMGLIEDCHQLTDSDLKIGHRRMYDLASLRKEIEVAGLTLIDSGGMFLKPLSNAQMMNWEAEVLEGLYRLGDSLPELCTEIYAVAGVSP